ncbi:aminoglycoside N(3)-acetyltransferase [Natronolimnobius baerhuensis]|uniref:AAC(3) family N-acetyltransferase n=1 Tax=Natronolimnobius baerhuensis TaxID=253108 RepID=A0A202ECG3_9EURY|nr:AAC(3) family N-acetyltransferase [Natronolimnobius baerhuensis]OVE85946.1 AAC(3) family N-acetyltransferase [Natronolimnobius baerhuensis]
MSEADAVERVDEPATVASLASDLRDLDIAAGDTLFVHSSLSALGWVCGDAPAVVDALQTVLTDAGTLVMPTHSPQYTNPADWSAPPVPDDWIDPIREQRPAYRPETTPTRGMGAIPECFRNYPGVIRSAHPTVSVAAWGADADAIAGDHALDYGLGESSPLARLYDHDAAVLMLGTGHETNTSLHLAEHRAAISLETTTNRVPIIDNGERVLVDYKLLDGHTDDFPDLGAAFEAQAEPTTGTVADATALLIEQPALVDFAVEWLEEHRESCPQ